MNQLHVACKTGDFCGIFTQTTKPKSESKTAKSRKYFVSLTPFHTIVKPTTMA